jgi:hypothetical protein
MKFKKFRDLVAGDRFLYETVSPSWEVAADTPEPLDDDNPLGLWKVYTKHGKTLEFPDTNVTVKKLWLKQS